MSFRDYDMNVYIEEDFRMNSYKVLVFEELGDGKVRMMNADGRFEEVERDDLTPAFTIHRHIADRIVSALAEKGVKSDDDHKIAGKLESTKDHLEDMRRIVFDHGLLRAREVSIEGDNSGSIEYNVYTQKEGK